MRPCQITEQTKPCHYRGCVRYRHLLPRTVCVLAGWCQQLRAPLRQHDCRAAGRLREARRLCEQCSQPWRSASLGGGGACGPLPLGAAAEQARHLCNAGSQPNNVSGLKCLPCEWRSQNAVYCVSVRRWLSVRWAGPFSSLVWRCTQSVVRVVHMKRCSMCSVS